MNKRRILWVSDSPGLPTGNAKITRRFIECVNNAEVYEIAVLGRGYVGWPGERDKFGCAIYPMDIGRQYPDIMKEINKEYRPQVVISCLDMWQIDWIEHAKISDAVTNIGYISIYGKPVPFNWKKVVKNLDLAICYSEFGRTVLKEFMPFTSIDMIHLGVDTSIYRPLENREELRKKFKLDGKFVIGCIARNQTRKRLDKLIEGFAKFSAKKPNAWLYLKTEKHCDHGYDIPELLEYHGVADKATVDEKINRDGYSEDKLAEIYNLFDVYVQTAGAEGFGIPILEAMSCGLPVMTSDYSACTELVKDRGILLKPYFPRVIDMATVEQVSINTDEMVEKLIELYENREYRFGLGQKARDFAGTLTWDKFADRWLEILSRIAWEV